MNALSPAAQTILEDLSLDALVSTIHDWWASPGTDFASFERKVREQVMAIKRGAIAVGLRALDVNCEEIEVDGRRYRRCQKPSTKKYSCLGGDLTVERNLYRPADGQGRSICPLELRAGMVEGTWTPGAAEIMAQAAAVMTPYEAAPLLAKFGGFKPSRSSLDRLPKSLSERWEKNRWDWENILREQEVVHSDATTVSISLDGVKIPMADGDRSRKRALALEQGKQPRGPNGYREASCATFTVYDEEGNRLETIYHGRMPESMKPTLHEQLEAEASSYLQGMPLLNFVCQSDGAPDNWRILDTIVESLREQEILAPDAKVYRITDFYHATEHLKKATDLYYGKDSPKSQSSWAELRLRLLKEPDGVDTVIRRLTYFRNRFPKRSSRRKKLTKVLKYFRDRIDMMAYADFVAKGLPIGTGVTEAACKTLVTQRMKRSGMRWAMTGGQGVLTLRSLLQSARWERGWTLLAQSYRPKILAVKRFGHLELIRELDKAA